MSPSRTIPSTAGNNRRTFSSVSTTSITTGKSVESIFDLTEAADWIEREIHEEYGIDFTGREYEPLLLRQGETMGVNLRDAVAVSKEKI